MKVYKITWHNTAAEENRESDRFFADLTEAKNWAEKNLGSEDIFVSFIERDNGETHAVSFDRTKGDDMKTAVKKTGAIAKELYKRGETAVEEIEMALDFLEEDAPFDEEIMEDLKDLVEKLETFAKRNV